MADTSDFGLLPTGLNIMTEDDVVAGMEADLRAEFGPGIEPGLQKGILRRLVRIFAERIGAVWELGEAVNSSQNPSAAGGTALEALCALTGTTRNPATPSEVVLTLTGAPTTIVPINSQAGTALGDRFATLVASTIGVATAWVGATGYLAGAIRTNATRVYLCTTAGTSAGSGGPTTTDEDITDNTAHWRFIGEGAGYSQVAARSTALGPIVGAAGDINVIETAIGGWTGVANILDATLGQDVETDAALRVRRLAEITRTGTSTVNAIRADILSVPGVATCTVFENVGDVTNVDGMPPHSVEVLVQGTAESPATDQQIADAILLAVPAGIATTGTTTASSTDSAGNVHAIKFTRPTLVPIYVAIEVLVQNASEADDFPSESTFPADGADQIKLALATAAAAAYVVSRSVYATYLGSKVWTVDGIININGITVGVAPSPVAASVAIGSRELATFDTTRITVTVVP